MGLGLSFAACSTSKSPTDTPPEDSLGMVETNVGVRFHFSAEESQARSLASSFYGIMSLAPADIEFTDVGRILVDVRFADTDDAFMLGFDLTEITDDRWEGEIPFLPSNSELRFIAHAFNTEGDEIFTGETLTTLTLDNTTVEIPLAPAQDQQTFDMPRMLRIAYPEQIVSGQEVQMIFTLEGNAGEAIDYSITHLDGSTDDIPFSPSSGTVTLTNTVADFIAVYTGPDVAADASFDYLVTITAADSLSSVAIATNLTTNVIPRADGIDGVENTRPSVLFNPVVLELVANGTATPGTVELLANISDDGDPADLTFQWTYTPADGTPDATFADNGQTNPALLEGYTVDHQGTITFAVTDINGGTTTLIYELVPNQFADVIDNEAVNGLNKIVAGEAHTCVLTGEGKVRCWGENQFGQLGYGNALDIGDDASRLPHTAGDVALLTGENVVQITAGNNHTCALLDFGFIRCWGDNQFGQLGYNSTENLADGEPVTSFGYVSLGGTATKIAAGGNQTCAILEDSGALRCWGRNHVGQLGYGHVSNIGDDETVFSVGNIELDTPAVDVVVGEFHTCALLDTGNMRCWGLNDNGELGYGNTITIGDDESLAGLTDVQLPGPVRKMGLGRDHTCALLENGAIRCWGHNGRGAPGYGIANNSFGDQANEVPLNFPDVAVGAEVTDMSVGLFHTCALLSDSQLKCWGEGANGRLGYGNTNDVSPPRADGVDLDGVSAYQMATGQAHTCALRSNGTARCWGFGGSGRLGSGATGEIRTPAAAPDIQVFEP